MIYVQMGDMAISPDAMDLMHVQAGKLAKLGPEARGFGCGEVICNGYYKTSDDERRMQKYAIFLLLSAEPREL
jgi:hypothetical protein